MPLIRRQLISFNGIIALVLFVTALAAVTQYGRRTFFRDPSSVFYDSNRAFDRFYSMYRQHDAERFMDKYNVANPRESRKGNVQTQMCVVFPTTRRPRDESTYLYHTLGSALASLSPAERSQVHMKMFFTHTDPSQHADWESGWVRALADEAFSYNGHVTSDDLEQLLVWEASENVVEKRPFDYAAALESCVKQGSPYIVIFEDDILIAEGWLARTLATLRDATKDAASHDSDWLSMRMFDQETDVGWRSDGPISLKGLPVILLVDAVAVAAFILSQRISRTVRRHFDLSVLLILCLLVVPTFTTLFFHSGKASLAPPKPGVRPDIGGCCTQALAFNAKHAGTLADYLKSIPANTAYSHAGRVNWMIRDFAAIAGLRQLSLYPMQTQHMGLLGAMQTEDQAPERVWSMAFEQLNALPLRREHLETAKRLFGNDLDAPIKG